ncbi:MAG: tRNA (cytidine(34)-2'-O)-methyltransferase [Sulfuricaulis sp.]
MFHVVLYQPEIPPNTGNIMRLCANTGTRLHLIEPLGFRLEDKALRRAGLDYREWVEVQTHQSMAAFVASVRPPRLLAFSTHADRLYSEMSYQPDDALLFGPETRGLPQHLLDTIPAERRLRLPLIPGNRSLNLANAVAVAVYQAWQQHGFVNGK